MSPIDPFTLPTPRPVVVGTGRLTLDVIVRQGATPRCQAGGTCGNVLANLAWLGWDAYPLTDLGADEPTLQPVREYHELQSAQQVQALGDSLPIGLRLLSDAVAGAATE